MHDSHCNMKGVKNTKNGVKRAFVDHTYHDYSKVEVTDIVDDYKEGTYEELFPAKLHLILSSPKYSRIISWRPHGRAWYVINKDAMRSIVLPIHFKHNNFESFRRSANGWGFKRLCREGPDHEAYYHELFLRGKPELVAAMTRLVNPGKRSPNKDNEPDFSDISKKYPLPAVDYDHFEPPPIHTPSPIKRPRSPPSPRAEPEPNPTAPYHAPQYEYGQQQHHGVPPAGPYPPPPPAYVQPRHYYLHGRAPPYSEPPYDHRPSYGAYHHHHHAYHGQHYDHLHHIATPSRAAPPPPPNTARPQAYQFQHQSPWEPLPTAAAAPAASTSWQSPLVQSGYHQYQNHPPPPSNEHDDTIQQSKKRKSTKMAPVVHTNQDRSAKASNTNYWDQSHTSAEREGNDYELDDRKPAAPVQDTATLNRASAQHTTWSDRLRVPAQHTTWNDPNLEHSTPSTQILDGPELHSSSIMRSWQHNEDDYQYDYGAVVHAPYPDQSAQVLAAPPAPEMRWSPSDNYTAQPASYYTAPPQDGSPNYSRTNGQRRF